MYKKFRLNLGQWRECPGNSLDDCFDVFIKNCNSRESGRFYFIEDWELSQKDNDGDSICVNGWRFCKNFQIHDAKECWNMQDCMSERFSIHALSPDNKDYIFNVNDTIKGLSTIENLVNTLYVISLCSTIEDAELMKEFIHDKGLLSKYSPDYYFTLLYRVRNIIVNVNTSRVQLGFIDWLKRLYKVKYQQILENLKCYTPSI